MVSTHAPVCDFGTPAKVFSLEGVEPFPDEELGVRYRAWGIKELHIAEGRAGEVDTIYLLLRFTVQRMVSEYGLDKVSRRVRELYNNNQFIEEIDLQISIEQDGLGFTQNILNGRTGFQSPANP